MIIFSKHNFINCEFIRVKTRHTHTHTGVIRSDRYLKYYYIKITFVIEDMNRI